jgi:uncharacterized repeat protein (TIGR02543 family)
VFNPYNINGNLTLTAQWAVTTIIVTFNSQGGSTPDPTSKQVTYGQNYGALPVVERAGYIFMGWYNVSEGGTNSDNKVVPGTKVTTDVNHTVYAYWKPMNNIVYTVHYYLLGTTNRVAADKTVRGQLMASTVTERAIGVTGYRLFSLQSQTITLAASGNEISFYYVSNTVASYTVVFTDGLGTTINTQYVTYGSDAVAPDDPTRDGYTFVGWDTSFSNITGDLTVNALWQVIPAIPIGTGNTTETSPPDTTPTVDEPVVGTTDTNTASWSLFDLICMILCVIAAVVGALRPLLYRRRDDNNKNRQAQASTFKEKDTFHKARILTIVFGFIVAIALIVLFFLTQDLTQPMVFFDWWSIVFAIGLILAIVFVILDVKKVERTQRGTTRQWSQPQQAGAAA